ncbi:MraY family glycosyltransferase [Pseudofulvibacter geojedonensis]|uniref:Glycosyltransferase family 4 protein n=1 Tax=Pseudofulvibacter geojedonensis TaxID=1123758 RepID=A0ABW3I413_9FLAO
MLVYLVVFFTLLIVEIIYLKLAKFFNISDTPNHRSAHVTPTLRGGGIILVPAILLFLLLFPNELNDYIGFCLAVLILAIISFIDDIITLSSKIRIIIHVISLTIVFYSLNLFQASSLFEMTLIFLAYIFSLGYLNIYNFMDGINGITFLNALITFVTYYLINEYIIEFSSSDLLMVLIFAIVVFGIFNFRKKPKCFAGDVGSITIGFTIIYFIIKLFSITGSYAVFLMLGVYLLDGGWTIIERLVRKENILEAHRRHLYQLFANEIKVPHLKISLMYFLVQMFLNLIVLYLIKIGEKNYLIVVLIFMVLSIGYFFMKRNTYRKVNQINEK